ncbi:MAG: 1-acyl-sn-glycerol-3-phosphate acyltransferase [Bacteroidales bacterium]|nr:1-acyl-sn-glycerol-3-phosphate acyltransferase [Bacteroidales bacterium]
MPLLPVSELERLSPIFRGKAGNMLAAFLRKVLSVSTVSDLNDKLSHLEGAEFAGALLKELRINYKLGYPERLADLPEGPFITVSNHPYGSIDGIILVDLFGHLRDGFKVMVNEFLAMVKPLAPRWIVVNPKTDASNGVTGKSIQGVRKVLSHLHSGEPIGFFPSGAVSDLSLKEMKIRDREWQETVIRLIKKAEVPIVPVRFFDHNSLWFYELGLIDWRIRTLQLPHEVVNKKHRRVRVGIGETLTVGQQKEHPGIEDFGAWLRSSVYDMPKPDEWMEYNDYVAARDTKNK